MIDYIELIDCFLAMQKMNDGEVDVIFTSPPYNRKRNDKYSFYDDVITDYFGFLKRLADESLRIVKKHAIINIQKNYYQKRDVFRFIGEYCDKIQEIIIWEKSNPMPANGFNITNAYEFFIVLGNKPLKGNRTYTKNIITTSVNSNMPKTHKAVMKKEVCEWFIDNFTKDNDIVLDPFLGCGTTAVVCKEKHRHYIGYEIAEEYFNIAKKALEDFK